MAIDVGEGLRKIQPITEMAKGTEYDFTKSADFRENFEKCLREHQDTGKEVLRKVKYSWDRLYNKYGVQPQCWDDNPRLCSSRCSCMLWGVSGSKHEG